MGCAAAGSFFGAAGTWMAYEVPEEDGGSVTNSWDVWLGASTEQFCKCKVGGAALFGLSFSTLTASDEPFCDKVLSSGSIAFSKTSNAVLAYGEEGVRPLEEIHSLWSVLVLLHNEPESHLPSRKFNWEGSEPSDRQRRNSDGCCRNSGFFGDRDSSNLEASAVIPGASPLCLVDCFPFLTGLRC